MGLHKGRRQMPAKAEAPHRVRLNTVMRLHGASVPAFEKIDVNPARTDPASLGTPRPSGAAMTGPPATWPRTWPRSRYESLTSLRAAASAPGNPAGPRLSPAAGRAVPEGGGHAAESAATAPRTRTKPLERVTPGEIALGMDLFIILYATRAGRLVWNEAFLNTEDTRRETAHHATHGTGEITAPTAGPAVTATVGTKAVGSGSPWLPR